MGNYRVYLGNLTIYQVSAVDSDAKRDLTVYDGVEQGKFPVAKNPDLHTWTVSCELTANRINVDGWEPAQDIFKELDKMMKSKDPDRLVMVGDCGKVSELVLVKGYSQTEKYEGVYSVKLQLTQYKEASVRTQDVPYIPRPGKVPEIPKSMVFKSYSEVAQTLMPKGSGYTPVGGNNSPAEGSAGGAYRMTFTDKEGNVYTNPNTLPLNKEVYIQAGFDKSPSLYDYQKSVDEASGSLNLYYKRTSMTALEEQRHKEALEAMKKANNDFQKELEERRKRNPGAFN